MMIRIDLLADAERRQQGPVRTRFAVRLAALTLALSAGLGVVWLAVVGRIAETELRQKESHWKELEPRVNRMRQLRQRQSDAEAMLNELGAWSEIRQPAHVLLEHIQQTTPSLMQFLAMELRDDITARRPRSETEPFRPYRQLRLRIQGRSAGERSEDAVAKFIQALRAVGGGKPLLARVSLLNLQADLRSASGASLFEIEAQGEERYLRGATLTETLREP